jgi:uncharacterized protein YkwD
VASAPAHATHRPRRHRRLLLAVGVVAAVALVAAVVTPAVTGPGGGLKAKPAQASDAAATLVSKLNAARQSSGLAPLAQASDLTSVAAERASIMARNGSLSHTPDLGGRVCCWSWIGENVAYGGSASIIHQVLMGSAPHRANILKADADDVGVAVVSANGQLWAAQVFRARNGSGSGGRSDDASSASRSGERSSPTTVVPSPDGTVSQVSGPTAAQLARQKLKDRLRSLRAVRKDAKKRLGPFDPVRAAVRYAGTLDRVTK